MILLLTRTRISYFHLRRAHFNSQD